MIKFPNQILWFKQKNDQIFVIKHKHSAGREGTIRNSISGAAIPACGIGRVAQLVSFLFIYLDG